MGLKNVFDKMFLKHLIDNVFKHFMSTVCKKHHDECLKNISSITLISLATLKMLKNFYSQT